jgi:hypothetical protein
MRLVTHFGQNAARWIFDVLKEPRIYGPVFATPAVIDVVSCVERAVSEKTRVWVATLTYFYRNPDLQMGDFERDFPARQEARQWAEQFKGRSVMVHVNPANPADSVLMERDLAGLELHRPLKVDATQPDPNIPDDYHEALTPGLRLVSGLGELVSTAGLASCAVLLAFSFAKADWIPGSTFYWTCGVMLACSLSSVFILWLHLRRSEAGRSLLHNYSRWSPPWMRWSLKVSGVSAAALPFFHLLPAAVAPVLRPWINRLSPHIPYLVGCFLFFIITAFLAAILRSQEELSPTPVSV